MLTTIWKTFSTSLCSVSYYNKLNIEYAITVGFRYGNNLISGSIKRKFKKEGKVVLKFCSHPAESAKYSHTFSAAEFAKYYEKESDCLNGILVIPFDFPDPVNRSATEDIARLNETDVLPYRITPTELIKQKETEIGTPVAILSCSRKLKKVHMKRGIISSHLQHSGHNFILIDASFDHHDAGSPVIDGLTGKLIGVVSDCVTQPSDHHNRLTDIIDYNLNLLKKIKGKGVIETIDPVQVLEANQYMMKYLSNELYLSSHKNLGLVVPIDRVLRFCRNRDHNSQFE